jgi:hypothetical protein
MLVASFPVAAQCPSGFLDAGEVSAVAAPGKYQEVEVTRELALPLDIQIDDSYHQKSIQAASDGAASDMRAAQIPAGIHHARRPWRWRLVVDRQSRTETHIRGRQGCQALDIPN